MVKEVTKTSGDAAVCIKSPLLWKNLLMRYWGCYW